MRRIADALTVVCLAAGLALVGLLYGLACASINGCSPQIGDPNKPAVQMGSATQPMMQADANVVVAVLSPQASVGDLASPRAGRDLYQGGQTTASQPAAATSTQGGSGDQSATNTAVSASGSAWGIVAVVAMLVAGFVAVAWIRATMGRQAERANARAVAAAIREQGPGPQRDRLLGNIEALLPDETAWKRTINGLAVRRRKGPSEAPANRIG